MTDRTTLEALLARVLEGEGPDRELDVNIARAFGWRPPPRGIYSEWWPPSAVADARKRKRGILNYPTKPLPMFTTSLDAALALVPEGWHWSVSGTVNREYHARIVPPAGSLKTFVGHWREAKSAPRALIAVCIKARMEAQGD